MARKLKVVDLFSGLGGATEAFKKRGHEVFTVDINPMFNPDLVADELYRDIMALNPLDFPFRPDVVWASPPCETFSVASIGTHWGGGYQAYKPKTKSARQAIDLVKHTKFLIRELKPKLWFIENPRGVLRKLDVMKSLPAPHTITLCQYGDKRMKPTDVWTNSKLWEPRPACKNGDPCHEKAPRGAKAGTQGIRSIAERAKMPYELSLEIAKVCESEAPRRFK